ncbi:MAG: hypothetical protein K2P81_00545 [Bacteriovoracaceae bacterium]|nr:hypothetical protein [Bacteriovoracaceae bacterium]
MKIDGHEMLRKVLLEKAGYLSLSEAIAEMTVFMHPDTVSQTNNQNIFKIIRDAPKRGTISNDGLMYDDNNGPARAFEWAINEKLKWKDVQFNHIYSDSQNEKFYTSLANLCLTPAFLAKLTDTDNEIQNLLKYRSYDLYGFAAIADQIPTKPDSYDNLKWHPFPEAVPNLELSYRQRMKKCLSNRATLSAIQLGWHFSKYLPDNNIK